MIRKRFNFIENDPYLSKRWIDKLNFDKIYEKERLYIDDKCRFTDFRGREIKKDGN